MPQFTLRYDERGQTMPYNAPAEIIEACEFNGINIERQYKKTPQLDVTAESISDLEVLSKLVKLCPAVDPDRD